MTAAGPVVPTDAATVVLVRPGQVDGAPWQCFMVRRHVRSDFAADVYVFPGGKVDEADATPDVAAHVAGERAPIEDDVRWRTLRLAAIRELFEEAGVLLASRDRGRLLSLIGPEAEHFAGYRSRLQTGEMTMLDLAGQEHLTYRADLLHPFSRWITPTSLPRRYDTRFYVAHLPDDQEPLHDAIETTEGTWISPGDALREYRAGRFPLVFATEKHLERMARYESPDEMIANTTAQDLVPITPRIVHRGGAQAFLLPGDPGYDDVGVGSAGHA